jgi:lysophospholipase L1-like esterase
MTDADFIASVDRLVGEVRHDCPEAKILLTTPCEAQKAQRRSRGRGRRTHTVYAPNRKVGRFSTLLVNYGRDNGIAVYDFYSVAGGDLSSSRWLRAGLFSRDRIHLSWPGYSLMGRLTADALITCLESLKQTNPDNATGNQ